MSRRLLALLATTGLVLGAAAVSARAQVDVAVAVVNPGGSRTLYVEDLAGNSLTSLDLSNARSLPFRVRVVDSTMDRTGFSVSASMTHVYRDLGGGSLDWNTKIPSADVSVSAATNPLDVLSVSARVQPVFDTVSTVTDAAICTLLSLPIVGGSCTINTANVTGLLHTVPLAVNLADLSGLPLLPQSPSTGAFTNPSFAGVAASDPAGAGAPAATSRQLVSGSAVSTAAVLTNVQSALATVLSGETIGQQIDTAVLTGALRTAVGVTWDLLSAAQVTTVLNSTVATLHALVPGDVIGQTGTYMSFPQLDVTVPNGSAAGTYRGTLVVTGLQ